MNRPIRSIAEIVPDAFKLAPRSATVIEEAVADAMIELAREEGQMPDNLTRGSNVSIVLEYIRAKGEARRRDILAECGISPEQAHSAVCGLSDRGLIKNVRRNGVAYWYVP